MSTTPLQTLGPTATDAPVPFRRLLVPLDGSDLAEQALPFARALACTLKADVILVRVASVHPPVADMIEAQIKAAAETQTYLEKLAETYRTDYASEYSVPFGDPVAEIQAVAEVRSADLIVMATHGRSGLSRLLLGSVADQLARKTNLPLLLVRGGLGQVRRWGHGLRRILVPLDGSALAESVLPRVAALAQATQAQLTLLQIAGRSMPELQPYEIAQLPENDQALADRGRAYLRGVATPLTRQGTDVRTRVEMGTPGEAIVAAATEQQSDLIAMSTHGRVGIDRAIVGSVADDVLRTADVPLLLLRK